MILKPITKNPEIASHKLLRTIKHDQINKIKNGDTHKSRPKTDSANFEYKRKGIDMVSGSKMINMHF